MAEVLLFHHVQGKTKGFTEFADRLRSGGHTVHTPDLFDGRTFDSLADGMKYAQGEGFAALGERGAAIAAELPAALVYMGISFGVVPAQRIAQTRPGAAGAVFLDACLPVTEFSPAWPAGVPVPIHGMDHDEFFDEDLDAAKALVASTDDAELFLYPGDQHLFTDSSLPSHDAGATSLLTERVLAFLDRV